MSDPMAEAYAHLNIQLAEVTIERDQLRADLAALKERVTRLVSDVANQAEDLAAAQRRLGEAEQWRSRARGFNVPWIKNEGLLCCPLCDLAHHEDDYVDTKVHEDDCLYAFLAPGSSTGEAWAAEEVAKAKEFAAAHKDILGEPAAPEPVPAPGRPVCDTPGCGKPIPIGGEGHPEICPDCLERMDREDAADPASAQGTTPASHELRLDAHRDGIIALDKRVAALAEKFDALWEACRMNGVRGLDGWRPFPLKTTDVCSACRKTFLDHDATKCDAREFVPMSPPQPAPVERHPFVEGPLSKGGAVVAGLWKWTAKYRAAKRAEYAAGKRLLRQQRKSKEIEARAFAMVKLHAGAEP